MTARSKRFAAATVVVGVIIAIVMVRIGMEPSLLLIGCMVVLAAAVWRLAEDLARDATPLTWQRVIDVDNSVRPDRRVEVLRSRLRQVGRTPRMSPRSGKSIEPDPTNDVIVHSLLMVIDDHLLEEHGIRRSADPDAATQILGAELARFAHDPSARRSMTRPRHLPHTVAMIEAL